MELKTIISHLMSNEAISVFIWATILAFLTNALKTVRKIWNEFIEIRTEELKNSNPDAVRYLNLLKISEIEDNKVNEFIDEGISYIYESEYKHWKKNRSEFTQEYKLETCINYVQGLLSKSKIEGVSDITETSLSKKVESRLSLLRPDLDSKYSKLKKRYAAKADQPKVKDIG